MSDAIPFLLVVALCLTCGFGMIALVVQSLARRVRRIESDIYDAEEISQ